MEEQDRKLIERLIQTQEQLAQCTCDAAQALRCIDKNLASIETTLKLLVPKPLVAKSATLSLRAN